MPANTLSARLLALFLFLGGMLFGAALAAAAAPGGAPQAARIPVAAAAAQSPDGRHLAPDIAKIVRRGELVVAMLGVDTPPFFYEKNGELAGLEVEIAHGIARELGVNLRFDRSARTFNQVVDIVAAGGADLGISKLSRTLARMQVVRFSNPYLSLGHSLVLNRLKFAQMAGDRPLPEVIRDYRGSMGVIAKSSFVDYAKKNFPHAQVVEYPGWPEIVAAVGKGEVVAGYRDEFEVKRIFKDNPTTALNFRSVTFKDLSDDLGIAVNVHDGNLLAFVNEYLAQRHEKLTIQKMLNYGER